MVRIEKVDLMLKRSRIRAALFFVSVISVLFSSVAAQPETAAEAAKFISPERLSSSFATVAKQVEPAVVSIDTKGKMPETQLRGDGEERSKDLEEFIRRNVPPRPVYAVGSGFLVDADGHILTNYHVVKDAVRIKVKLPDGTEFEAKVMGADEETDLAVLKIEAGKPLAFVRFGDSDNAQIGDWVLAIGSPFGLARTVTAGIISQTNRETSPGNPFQTFLQTDAAINRGNSGGPLVDMDGNVIGVNSQIATSTGDYNGIGFALPSNEARNVYEQIVSYGKVKRGYLGVYLESVGSEFAEVYGLGKSRGAVITSVRNPTGAAAKAGLQDNDIILSVNDKAIVSAQDLIGRVSSTPPGKDITINFLREVGDKLVPMKVSVRLDERPVVELPGETDTPRKLPLTPISDELPFGLTLTFADGESGADNNYKGYKGLLIRRIDPLSFISEETTSTGLPALLRGDLIERINRKQVESLDGFKKTVAGMKLGDSVVLHVKTYDRDMKRVIPRIVQFTVK